MSHLCSKEYSWRSARTIGIRRPFALSVLFVGSMLLVACTSNEPIDNASTTSEPAENTVAEDPITEPENSDEQLENSDSPLPLVTADLDGALLGISTGLTDEERRPRFEFLEEQAGRQFDIGHVFHGWNDPIPTADDLMHIEDGRILMISWNGTDTIAIQDGVHDAWITTQAAAVRDLGQPVMLRWAWEMDAPRRRGTYHSGEDYVAAWLHIRQIFDEVGATNAQFVWCPNEFLFWDGGDPEPWYPGDEHVDWLCADGYNWPDSVDHPEWISFTDIFKDFVAWAEPRGLPIVIAETGSNEAFNDPQGKADWLRSLPMLLEQDLSAIDAVVYFDKDFRFQGHPNWMLDTSEESFAAWNEIANDPYFTPLG